MTRSTVQTILTDAGYLFAGDRIELDGETWTVETDADPFRALIDGHRDAVVFIAYTVTDRRGVRFTLPAALPVTRYL